MPLIVFILDVTDQVAGALGSLFVWGSDYLQLIMLSFAAAFVFMLVFKKISNQSRIAYHRDQIIGHLLEISIYRDRLSRILVGQAAVFKHTFFYLGSIGKPFLILVVPMLLLCMQIESRFGYQPIRIGEPFLIKAQLDPKVLPQMTSAIERIFCRPSPGVKLETPALRIASESRTYWRAVAKSSGTHRIRVGIDGDPLFVDKGIVAGGMHENLNPVMAKASSWQFVLNASATPITPDAGLLSLSIGYPKKRYSLFHWQLSPIVFFFVLSLAFGIPLKFWMKVKI